jgi:hypothetical protein
MTIRQILLVPHTHHDVGYTNSPRIIDPLHARIVDRVLDLACPAGDGPDALRWTFEAARPVLRFLREAPPERRALLVELARQGRLSVTGGYLNMTQLPGIDEFGAAYALLDELREAGLVVRTQQHGDVNGISWGTADQMRDAGISRLVMALNPDHGRPPFTQPSGFWWEAPTGRRVFVWLSTHYGFGEEWGIIDGDVQLAERRVGTFLDGLEAREDYPWTTAIVHAANDNRWPTDRFLGFVRHWNDTHPDIPMRTATIDEALDRIAEESAGHDLPVVRGEWADWWSHGHGSTAREVAVYREARTFARLARGSFALASLRGHGSVPLAEVLGYRRGPVRLRDEAEIAATIAHVDEQLLLYGEHTWGSWETYSKPHSTFSHSHHNAKSAFAYDAFDHARDLAIEGWYRAVHADGATIDATEPTGHDQSTGQLVVVNDTELDRSELIDVEVDGVRRVWATARVPAFGTAVIDVPEPFSAWSPADVVETMRYRIAVDPSRGGIASLTDLTDGRELVDQHASAGLGAVVVEQIEAGSTHPMVVTSPKLFHPDSPGPKFDRLPATARTGARVRRGGGITQVQWESSAPHIPTIITTLTTSDTLPEIEIDVWLSKPQRLAPESVFVSFPFDIDDPEFLLETAGAVFRAGDEQLPDTSSDWYSIQHAAGVSGSSGGVLWGTRDAPLVQLGGFHTGEWARRLDAASGHVNSWLANNLHFTNFQASQELTRSFRYRLRPAAEVTAADVRRFGRDLHSPLQARHLHGPRLSPARPALRVEPAGPLLTELAPLPGGRVRVRIRNISSGTVIPLVETLSGAWTVPAAAPVGPHGTLDVIIAPPY